MLEPASATASAAPNVSAARPAKSTTATARPTYEELEAEVEKMREVLTAYHYAQHIYRFHCFDAINDDTCPSCGGPVEIETSEVFEIRDGRRMPQGTRLVATRL